MPWPKNLRYCPGIFLEGLRKPKIPLVMILGVPAKIQNRHLYEYKSEALPLHPTCPVARRNKFGRTTNATTVQLQ
jgi:hypothetical protein